MNPGTQKCSKRNLQQLQTHLHVVPICKKFEKCFYNQLNNFFSSFQLLNKQHFGFKQNRNTFLAVSSICNVFVQYLDEGKLAC